MAATAAATKAATQMLRSGKNDHAAVKIKIAGQYFLPP